MMKEQEAINYLENLESGNYVTINIPLYKDEILKTRNVKKGEMKDVNAKKN